MYRKNEDQDFTSIGTPFAPLEADEIVSRKPEIDQTVRDERGRRRFHGAFTGGFSAGYWNTVGTAEGFTPKIFVSSRKNKYDQSKSSKPEDYMDEEDFGSFGIAPKRIHTKDDFVENTSFAGIRDAHLSFDDVIKTIFEPAKESIGKRLFRQMKRHAKLEQKDKRSHMFQNEFESRKENCICFESKDNFHGLGYNAMLDPNAFFKSDSKDVKGKPKGNDISATLSGGRKLKISGEAFGYGALEEDDDMAVYSKDDMSQYDFSIGSITKPEKSKSKRTFQSNVNAVDLEGFALSKLKINLFNSLQKNYKPPELPRNWKPKKINRIKNKKSRWDSDTADKLSEYANENKTTGSGQSSTIQKQQNLNANLRAVILGEEVVYKVGVAKKQNEKVETKTDELAFDKVRHSDVNNSTTNQQRTTPLSGFLASKFTRSSMINEDPSINAGLSMFKDVASMSEFGQKAKSSSTHDEDIEKKPIRTIYEWHPHKLLCKRFGVQNPFPQFNDIVGIITIKGDQSTRNMSLNRRQKSNAMFSGLFQNLTDLNTFNPNEEESTINKNESTFHLKNDAVSTRNESSSSTNIEKDDDVNEDEDDEVPTERPPIDLFKSIFASDEESGDEDNDPEPDKSESNLKPELNSLSNVMKDDNGKGNFAKLSNSKGIFSGIDFQQLNQNFNPCLNDASQQKSVSIDANSNDNNDDMDDDDDVYGPALPPLQSAIVSHSNTINDSKPTHSKTTDRHHRHEPKKHKDKKIYKDKRKKKKKKDSNKKSDKHSRGSKRRRHSSSSCSSTRSIDGNGPSTSSNGTQGLEDELIRLIEKVRHGHSNR